jgi:hypothetical protein
MGGALDSGRSESVPQFFMRLANPGHDAQEVRNTALIWNGNCVLLRDLSRDGMSGRDPGIFVRDPSRFPDPLIPGIPGKRH